jgi:DNA-binding NarL/FixJ family response regulator
MPTITLLVAYPKELIRAGLRSMLAGSRIKIVGEAIDSSSTLSLAKKHKPAVVLLDAAIPGGDAFGLVAALSKTMPATKIVMLSANDNPTYMARARAVGAANCLLKDVSPKELITAIENATAGKPPPASARFAKIAASMEPRDTRAARDSGLTPRESREGTRPEPTAKAGRERPHSGGCLGGAVGVGVGLLPAPAQRRRLISATRATR